MSRLEMVLSDGETVKLAALARSRGKTEEYVETYERRNLLQLGRDERWPEERARQAAALLLSGGLADGDALVLCGSKVAVAFGLRYDASALPELVWLPRLAPQLSIPSLVIPHPSGLNRLWHPSLGLAPRVREAVNALREGRLGQRRRGAEMKYEDLVPLFDALYKPGMTGEDLAAKLGRSVDAVVLSDSLYQKLVAFRRRRQDARVHVAQRYVLSRRAK